MKIFIPTYGREEIISTHKLLDGYNWKIVVDNDEVKQKYLEVAKIPEERILVSGGKSLVETRKWIDETQVEMGEWYMTMDDNIKHFTAHPEPYYSKPETLKITPEVRKSIEYNEIEIPKLMEYIKEDLKLADKIGAHLYGFAILRNYKFRRKKYSPIGYIIAKAWCIKKSNVEWDTRMTVSEDTDMTAQHILHHGVVLRNNYIKPVATHYAKGGLGDVNKRIAKGRFEQIAIMLDKYPGLYEIAKKSTVPDGFDVRFKTYDFDKIQEWRKSLL